jgi:hypothetical protein
VTRAQYADRRQANLCAANLSCGGAVTQAGYCRRHYKRLTQTRLKSRAVRYLDAKVAGRCTRGGCKADAGQHSLFCDPHRESDLTARRAREAADPDRYGHRNSDMVARRLAKKLCSECGNEPLAKGRSVWYGVKCLERRARPRREALEAAIAAGTPKHQRRCLNCLRTGCLATRCPLPRDPRVEEVLADERRQRQRRRHEERAAEAGRALRVTHCSVCQRPRCKANTCPNRPAMLPLRLEDFMVGGQHALEAA